MLRHPSPWICLAAALVVLSPALVVGASELVAPAPVDDRPYPVKLRVVSTPNPSVFPLFVALDRNPWLASLVELVPVAGGSGIDEVFRAGEGDALLSMTYVAAKKAAGGVAPDLQLRSVNYWSGFFEVTHRNAGIESYSDLVGKAVIVSGPVEGGKNGGPDLIFQAALARSGVPRDSVEVCYLPVLEGARAMLEQRPLGEYAGCDARIAQPASGILLVEPAATGLVLESRRELEKSIDVQQVFAGFTSWPAGELPLGGVSVLSGVADDPVRGVAVDAFLRAYEEAARWLAGARSGPPDVQHDAEVISAGIETYYGQYGLELPAPVIVAAFRSGDLVYRAGVGGDAVASDLDAFVQELIGTEPPAGFYRLG